MTVSGQLRRGQRDPIPVEITFPADPRALDALLQEDSNSEFGSHIRGILMQAMRPLFFKRPRRKRFSDAVREIAPYAYVLAFEAVKVAARSVKRRANPSLKAVIEAAPWPRLKGILKKAHKSGFLGHTAPDLAALLVQRCFERAWEKFHIDRPTDHVDNFMKLYITGRIREARDHLTKPDPLANLRASLLLDEEPGQGTSYYGFDR